MIDSGGDTLVWMQNAEPISLYCADETDGETCRACEQINEALLSYKVGGTEVEPALAEKYVANDDLTEWTFNLREGVKFHDGSDSDAKDVVATSGRPSGMPRTRCTRAASATSPTSLRCSGPS